MDILQRATQLLRHFMGEDHRDAWLTLAFHGEHRGIYDGIPQNGATSVFTVRCVRHLLERGCVGSRHALSLLLETVRGAAGSELQEHFQTLIDELDRQCTIQSQRVAPATDELPEPLRVFREELMVRHEILQLTENTLQEIPLHTPHTLEEYRLARIAEWSQPRHALDKRFTPLALLLDQPHGDHRAVLFSDRVTPHFESSQYRQRTHRSVRRRRHRLENGQAPYRARVYRFGGARLRQASRPTWSMQLLKQYVVQVRTDLLTQVMQPGRFSSPESNLTFHIRERALNGELLGLLMHDTRDSSQAQSYLAERGQIVKQDPNAYLVMSNGPIIRRTDPTDPPQIIAFDRYAVDLDRFEPQDGGEGELKPRERYFSELYDPGPDSVLFKNQPGQFRAELHERFASPLYPFAFALLVIAFVGQAGSTRSSRMENLVVAFLVAAGARLGGLAINNLVAMKASFIPVLYGLPLMAMVIGVLKIKAGQRQRSGPSIGDRVHSVAEPVIVSIQTALAPLLPKRLRGGEAK